MKDIQWVTVIAALAGGGAAGALLTALFNLYRNRIQPIGFESEKIEVFKKEAGMSSLQAKITLTDNVTTYDFDNLIIVRLRLVNKGNQDMSEFTFGMTLLEDDKAVHVQAETPDRHHIAELLKPVSLDSPTAEIDYRLKPFNRNDPYFFNVFITVFSDKEAKREIKLSSAHPVKFVPIPTMAYAAGFTGPVGVAVIKKLIPY